MRLGDVLLESGQRLERYPIDKSPHSQGKIERKQAIVDGFDPSLG